MAAVPSAKRGSRGTSASRAVTGPTPGSAKPRARRPRNDAALRWVTPEERERMIATAAYLRAERRGFEGGSTMQDWLEAEAEVDAFLKSR